jgi:hypothetical protein
LQKFLKRKEGLELKKLKDKKYSKIREAQEIEHVIKSKDKKLYKQYIKYPD